MTTTTNAAASAAANDDDDDNSAAGRTITKTTKRKTTTDSRRGMLVGGFSPVKDISSSSSLSPRLLTAAEYAVSSLSTSTRTYSFMQTLRDMQEDNKASSNDDVVRVSVVKAEQQVVAGMNYRMIVMISSVDGTTTTTSSSSSLGSSVCIGAFAVTVYDQFGTLSVTRWGDEISCIDAMTILNGGNNSDTLVLSEKFNRKK